MSEEFHPPPDFSGAGPVEYNPAPVAPASEVARLLAREEARLLAIQGVTSVGIGLGPPGREALVVGVVDAGVAARLPPQIDGVPLVVKVTGTVEALAKR
ncbi:MAG TPA: hypothetical protein VF670_06980 [Duganella sp.]|jgi:hypothetical protein